MVLSSLVSITSHMTSIGVIAGQGKLPRLLIQALLTQEKPLCVLAVQGYTNRESVEGVSHTWVDLGEIGKALAWFKKHQVSHLVMAGKFQRPSLSGLKVDWKGAKWLAQLVTQRPLGDDTLLRFLSHKLEKEGFQILAPQDILGSLIKKEGCLTFHQPSPNVMKDVLFGLEVLKTLSPFDIGQAIIVQEGVVLGIEAAEGTDELIRRCAELHKKGIEKKGTHAPVLIKSAKMTQDERLDFPALGINTLKEVEKAGFQGIAFEAERTLILDEEQMVCLANDKKLFIVGVTA